MLRCYYHNCICIFTDVLNNCILYVYFYKQYCFLIKEFEYRSDVNIST